MAPNLRQCSDDSEESAVLDSPLPPSRRCIRTCKHLQMNIIIVNYMYDPNFGAVYVVQCLPQLLYKICLKCVYVQCDCYCLLYNLYSDCRHSDWCGRQ